ncbi:MAG: response regulator [Gammaproteobacteria bacterium]|nr:response regulator [Gammaproteobacteria bacterium]
MRFELDSRTWRADLLQIILNVAVTFGVVVYGISVYWAWLQGLWAIILIDTVVIAAVLLLWWLKHLAYTLRALATCLVIYFLGAMLLTVAGTVAQIYLLGHSAITTVLLGWRAGLVSVVINTLTLVGMGVAGHVVWTVPPLGWSGTHADWALVAANFVLVAAVVTLSVGGVLGTLESALARERTARGVLRERERRLQTLIDSTPDTVMVLDAGAAVLETNPSGLSLLQAGSEADVVGRPFASFLAEADQARFQAFHEQVCAGASGRLECDVVAPDAASFSIEIVSAPMPDDDGSVRHLAIARDLTANRKIAEQLRRSQRLDAVGKLTGGIAHDFNNLLTVILGSADQLCESLEKGSQLRSLAETTRSAAVRGASLTQRLLAFSRQQELNPRPVDVVQLLHGMESLLYRTLGDDIEVALVAGDEPCVALVDAHQLESAVLNLCINARDAMPAGGRLTLDVKTRTLDAEDQPGPDRLQAGEYVVISVTDTGEGMSAETLSRAFEPFYTTKDVGRGTGLGLSMVYGFVRQSSGYARIYSEPDHGTTVRLLLPAVHDKAAEATGAYAPLAMQTSGEHVLLVEDDDAVRELVRSQLEALGYRVTSAGNGPTALGLLQQGHRFDLLFTDVIMPGGMNGRELADAATGLQPDLPVLFTSGYSESAIVRDGRLPEGTFLLSKPYRRNDLARKLREVLNGVAE